ncbi:MAG: glucose-1-phosphate cytidylyltransferase [Anaerolineales bacterium]|nr:MAG: glucose-1-phosphate cytidylyltransferase [Anaerolineales bacterium]
MSDETLSVIILCGGMSMRMRGEVPTKKEMFMIGSRPVLWHVMKIYAAQGCTDFVLAMGYRAIEIRRYFLEYGHLTRDFTITLGTPPAVEYHDPDPEEGWRITFADTGLEVMTGARIRKAARYVHGDTFFATYGDGVADIDLKKLLAFHRSKGCLATVTGVRSHSRFGVLETDGKGMVSAFEEKPIVDSMINGGFFVFERKVLDYLAGGDEVILEREPLQRLAADGQLAVYEHKGFWRAMDTFKDAQQMSALWKEQEPWKVW